MNFISETLLGLLKFFYNVTNNYGVAIILLTITFRLVTLPLNLKQVKTTKATNAIMPEQKKIQEKYKNDPDKKNKELQELYSKYNINPLAGCLPLLIQLPIFIAMFRVIQDTSIFANTMFLGIDLAKPDQLLGITGVLPLLAGLTTYIQSKQTATTSTTSGSLSAMNAIMPIMIIYFSSTMNAGLALYWFVGNIFSIAQHYVLNKLIHMEPILADAA